MNISDLKPNPKNPRKITEKKLKAFRKSLEEFGDLSGIVFNMRTNHLIGGHMRVALLQDAKVQISQDSEMGVITKDGISYSLRVVDWDEDKELAANIAANKGAGEWDYQQLTEWMHDLDAKNFDLGLTMFDASEIESLFGLKEDKKKDEGKDKTGKKREATCPECGCQFEA